MMSASDYFQALLGPNFREGRKKIINLPNIDGATLKVIIQFCYTGKVQINAENIVNILSAASAMELVLIEEKCEQFWNENLATFNCIDIFSLADKYNFRDLRQKALEFICENFEAEAIGAKFRISIFHRIVEM